MLQNVMTDPNSYFPGSYEEARTRFRESCSRIRERWPEAGLHSFSVSEDDSLTIDWIEAGALEKNQKLFVLTTGEHGIEGYVGSAVLMRFLEIFLSELSPPNTGILLVQPLNPWGMKHFRRTNQNNVDLNRNFVLDEQSLTRQANPNYDQLENILNPKGGLKNLLLSDLRLFSGVLKSIFLLGPRRVQKAALMGQHRFSKGVYYGGNDLQQENRLLQELLFRQFSTYDQVVHIDIHTGYGPRYLMNLVNSPLEKRSSAQLAGRFNYSQVLKANAEEFYQIRGDLIDFVYTLAQREFPKLRLYATAFEFGTFGSSLVDVLRSLRASIYENQLYWYGAQNQDLRNWVEEEYRELFLPAEPDWRSRALDNAEAAFRGILKAEAFIG